MSLASAMYFHLTFLFAGGTTLLEHECAVSTSAIKEWSSMSMALACTSTNLYVLRLTSSATTVAVHALQCIARLLFFLHVHANSKCLFYFKAIVRRGPSKHASILALLLFFCFCHVLTLHFTFIRKPHLFSYSFLYFISLMIYFLDCGGTPKYHYTSKKRALVWSCPKV
jgi:hypothetical protein